MTALPDSPQTARMVETRFKEKRDCPCGCGTFGAVRNKTQKDGLKHVARCPCRRCRAPRHKQNASARERRVARDTGGSREPLSGALSGIDGSAGLWVWEETSEVAVVRGLRKWWENKGTQDKVARLMNRQGAARVFIASWGEKKIRPQLVVIPYDDWVSVVNDRATELDASTRLVERPS